MVVSGSLKSINSRGFNVREKYFGRSRRAKTPIKTSFMESVLYCSSCGVQSPFGEVNIVFCEKSAQGIGILTKAMDAIDHVTLKGVARAVWPLVMKQFQDDAENNLQRDRIF